MSNINVSHMAKWNLSNENIASNCVVIEQQFIKMSSNHVIKRGAGCLTDVDSINLLKRPAPDWHMHDITPKVIIHCIIIST